MHKTWIVSLAVVVLLAAAPAMAQTVHVDHRNVLFVGGSDAPDKIILTEYRSGGEALGVHVEINGVDYGDWPTAERDGITVRGYAGNDVINLRRVTTRVFFLGQHPEFEITITGDDGKDVIRGTQGHDTIFGGSGRDRIIGEAGNDVILGGDGNDILKGGRGHDVLEGNAGRRDRLKGGCGDDKLADKDGFRKIDGGDGDDKIYLTFPDGFFQPRFEMRVFGGYDEDLIEIFNDTPFQLELVIDGDIPDGYDDLIDTLVTHGVWDEDASFPRINEVRHF